MRGRASCHQLSRWRSPAHTKGPCPIAYDYSPHDHRRRNGLLVVHVVLISLFFWNLGTGPQDQTCWKRSKNKQLLEPTTIQLTVCGSLVWGFHGQRAPLEQQQKKRYLLLPLARHYLPPSSPHTNTFICFPLPGRGGGGGHQSKREKADGPSSLGSQCHQKAATTVSARVPSLRWSRCPDVCTQE